MIKKTHCVTYPRSGHGFLKKLLTAYFGDEFKHCDIYSNKSKRMAQNSETNFQKDHDFNNSHKYDPKYLYIIQIRNPIDSLISFFKLKVKNKKVKNKKKEWMNFALSRLAYWEVFYRKWVVTKRKNAIIVKYKDLTEKCPETVACIIKHIAPDHKIDQEKLKAVCDKLNTVKPKNRKDFKHYSESFFARLENTVKRKFNRKMFE